MKKLFLVGAIALFGAVNAQSAGNFKLGAHIGLPVGDAADGYSFVAGADVAYMWPVAAEFNLGVASGYNVSVISEKPNGRLVPFLILSISPYVSRIISRISSYISPFSLQPNSFFVTT